MKDEFNYHFFQWYSFAVQAGQLCSLVDSRSLLAIRSVHMSLLCDQISRW